MIMSLIDIHLFYKNTLAFGELRYCYEINSFKRMGSLKVDYTYPPAITKDFLLLDQFLSNQSWNRYYQR